jgi:hypothetical protein
MKHIWTRCVTYIKTIAVFLISWFRPKISDQVEDLTQRTYVRVSVRFSELPPIPRLWCTKSGLVKCVMSLFVLRESLSQQRLLWRLMSRRRWFCLLKAFCVDLIWARLQAFCSWTCSLLCQLRLVTSGSPLWKAWPQECSTFSWFTKFWPCGGFLSSRPPDQA